MLSFKTASHFPRKQLISPSQASNLPLLERLKENTQVKGVGKREGEHELGIKLLPPIATPA
jgi:hypothetical protein